MLLVLIIVPCTVVAIGLVALVDRGGWLSSREGWMSGAKPSPRRGSPDVSDTMRRALSLSAMAIMSAWILAWLVALVVGLRIIIGSG
jgi:hypothetical protein